jgi:peptidoglycan biosynthesis protein MviN/MurJ (putative lipid II flippase)
MAWVALFVFLGKLTGAAKEMAVAYRYGVGEEVDAYLFVLNLVTWPVGVWFSVLTVVLVPLAARIRQDAATQLPRFRAELFGLTFLIGLTLAILAWLGLPSLLRARWTGLPATTVALASEMVRPLVFLMPMGVIISLFSAWTLAGGRHANTLLEGVPALAIALTVLMLPGGGIEPLVWGTLAGFAFHLTSLAIPLSGRGEIEPPRFTRQSSHWLSFWQSFGIMLAGQALMSFVGIIDQFFAAHLGTGAIATLSYANRVLALILGLGATAVSRATLPVFSKTEVKGASQGHRLASHWVRLLFLLGVMALIAGWGLAPWMVRLLFERGAFTVEDTLAVSQVLRVGLLQIPFYFAALVLVSVLASQRHHKLIAIVASVNLITKLGANLAFVPLLGVSGIIAGTAFMYMVGFALLWWFSFFLAKRRNFL